MDELLGLGGRRKLWLVHWFFLLFYYKARVFSGFFGGGFFLTKLYCTNLLGDWLLYRAMRGHGEAAFFLLLRLFVHCLETEKGRKKRSWV
ncbi:hypothetical protein QBC43DRAFT_306232 [Cladorrhinum sp. PSN259]|nr:hypothetical protein QBC43DRAFT_306232 [Cladorrhinum sp. PSN259]